jgi:hypothetical protein
MAVVGMAKKPISKIHHLASRIEAHLHQFAPSYDDPTEEEDMAAARKRRNPYLRAGLAGGAVACPGPWKRAGRRPSAACAAPPR